MKLLIQNHNRTFFVIVLLVILVLPIIFPLFSKGFFVSDDGEWMVIRLSAFYEAFRSGQFPVRFLMRLNQGYGYPVADFLYPGFMYLGLPFHIIGFSFVDTVKIIIGGSVIASAVFSFFWLRKFFDDTNSIIGAILYAYAPYHLYDTYSRGSVGELLALAVIPFVLWQLERKSIFWAAISLGFLLISHNTLAIFFLCFLLIYMLFNILAMKNRREIVLRYLSVVMCGIGLSAFFWIPALYDLRYTVFSETKVSEWYSYFSSIWLVGLQIYLVFIGILVFFLTKKISPSLQKLTLLFLFLGLSTTFFATEGSAIFWKIFPVSFVQFPFRFLSISTLCASFLAAFLFSQFSKGKVFFGLFAIILFSGISFWQFVTPVIFSVKGDSFYSTNLDTTTVRNEYMPKWVKQLPSGYPHQKVTGDNVNITSINSHPNNISFKVQSVTSSSIKVHAIDFSGWEATVDGKKTEISHANPQGIIEISVPAGAHTVQVVFKETVLRRASDYITLVSFVILCLFSFYYKRARWYR